MTRLKMILHWFVNRAHVNLPEAKSWTMHLDTRWCGACDRCGRIRWVAQYMEMYGDENWWRECVWCAYVSIAKMQAVAYGQEAVWAADWLKSMGLGKGIEV